MIDVSTIDFLAFIGLISYLTFLIVVMAVILRTSRNPIELTPEDIADHRENFMNHCKDCMFCSGPTQEDQRE